MNQNKAPQNEWETAVQNDSEAQKNAYRHIFSAYMDKVLN
jgi:hypothetical protein